VGYDPVHEMVGAGPSPQDVRFVGSVWFVGALALYWLTGARWLIWADPSKLTLYALEGYFPSHNPGDHAGWTVVTGACLRLMGGDPVAAAPRLSAVCGAPVVVAEFNPGAVLRLAQVVRGWRTDLEVRPIAVDVALGAPDPAAASVAVVQREIGARPVVLADSYAPYYHPSRFSTHFGLHPAGRAFRWSRDIPGAFADHG